MSELVTPPISIDDPTDRIRWRVWAVIILVTIFLHFLLLILHPPWNATPVPPRIELKRIDPGKLEAIRRQWRHEESKQLLLDKLNNPPADQEAPPDARYFSDRNHRVAHEQRSKVTNVIPKPGGQPVPESKLFSQKSAQNKIASLSLPLNLSAGTPVAKPIPEHDNPRAVPPRQAMPEGGDQALLDKSLPEGAENLLNTQESVYYSFYARIYEAVGPLWQSQIREVPTRRRINRGDYSTQVDVIFDRDGNLLEIRRLQSSGIPEFDSAVDNSWHRIGRFPNPPHDLLDQSGVVHTGWTFTVQVGNGPGLDLLPPERNY